MSACDHRFLDLDDGLPCSLPAHPNSPHDHVYVSSSLGDAHTVSEQDAEDRR